MARKQQHRRAAVVLLVAAALIAGESTCADAARARRGAPSAQIGGVSIMVFVAAAQLPSFSPPAPTSASASPSPSSFPISPHPHPPTTYHHHPQHTGPAAASAASSPASGRGRSLLQGRPPWARGGGGGRNNGGGGGDDNGGDGGNDAFSGRVIVPSSGGGGDSAFGGNGGGNGNNRRGGPFGGGGSDISSAFGGGDNDNGNGGGRPSFGGGNRPSAFTRPTFGGGNDIGSAFGDDNDNGRPGRPMTRPFPSADGALSPRPVGGLGGIGGGNSPFGGNRPAFNRPSIGGSAFDDNENDNGGSAFLADRPSRPVIVNGNGNGNWNRPPSRPFDGPAGGAFDNNNRGPNNNRPSSAFNGPPALRPYRLGELEIRPEALQSGVPRVSGLNRPNINRGAPGAFSPQYRDRVYRGFGGVGAFGSRNFGSRADANAVAQTIAQAGGQAEATAAAEAVVEAARGGRATAVAEAYARAARFNRGGAARVMARSAAVAYERGEPYVQSLAQSTAEAFTAAKAAGTIGDFAGAMAQALTEGGEYGQAAFGQAIAKAMATTEGQAAVAEATASVFCGPNTYATAWAEAMSVALSRDARGCLVLNQAKAIAVARCNGGVFSAEAKAEATSRVLGFCGLRPWYQQGGGWGGGFGGGNNNNYYGDDNGFRGPIAAVPLPARGGGGFGGGGLAQSILNRVGERIDQRLG
jgi:hypothetical protein